MSGNLHTNRIHYIKILDVNDYFIFQFYITPRNTGILLISNYRALVFN